MSLQKLMTNYADYNMWANQTLIEWLKSKPADVFHKEVRSSFPGILKTLNHILAVEEFWQAVVSETAMNNSRYNAESFDTDEIINGIAAQSKSLADYVSTLSEKDLQQEVYLDTPWVKGKLARYEFLQHVFNHSTYHRGQITSMGHHLDLHDAPMTDYNYFNMAAKQPVSN
jgi:uncharacterized damage-inducible protein DinB